MPNVDEFLFGRGLTVRNYFIDTRDGFELICFTHSDGREFDLSVSDDRLKLAAVARLKALGVQVRD
jgi:hypothetical protein